MWTGVSIGIAFFIVASLLGYMAGLGNIFNWAKNLQECSCENAGIETCYTYLFQAKAKDDNKSWQCSGDGFGWQ